MWKGSRVPLEEQGVRILGTPLGHPHSCTVGGRANFMLRVVRPEMVRDMSVQHSELWSMEIAKMWPRCRVSGRLGADFTYTPEPHIAFCPIFVHPLLSYAP